MLVYKVDFNIDYKGAIVAMPNKSSLLYHKQLAG